MRHNLEVKRQRIENTGDVVIRRENTAFQADLESHHAKDAIDQRKIELPRPRDTQSIGNGEERARNKDKRGSKRKAPDPIRRRQADQDKEAHIIDGAPYKNNRIAPTIGIVVGPPIA